MSAPASRAPLGCGGAVGLGVAAVIVLAALVIGRAVLGQLEGAARVVIVFAEIALCVILGALVLAVLGVLAFGFQHARLHLAERRGQLGGPPVMRAEVIAEAAGRDSVPSPRAPAIQAKRGWDSPSPNVIRLPVDGRRGGDDA